MLLKIITPGRSFEFVAREGTTVIMVGPRAQDDVCIDDDSKVSAPHVRLEKSGDVWSFTDQFSDAGTIHNGAKIYNGDLKVGDTLQVGDSRIEVLDLAAEPHAAVAAEPAPTT
jgi:pSer/pThr/pTyr-binding forkhead associated (FHA) protein